MLFKNLEVRNNCTPRTTKVLKAAKLDGAYKHEKVNKRRSCLDSVK
jgi:hypothetical protein